MQRRNLPVQLVPSAPAAPELGHNGGPPLDASGESWLWQRAVRRAWKTPPRDIALSRLRQAEALGLSYREFASVLLDRGHHLRGLVLAVDTVAALLSAPALARLRSLPEIGILACVRLPPVCSPDWRPDDHTLTHRLNDALEGRLVRAAWARSPRERRFSETRQLPALISAFAIEQNLPPSAMFMAGSREGDLRAAAAAGMALFKWTHEYFAPTST